MSYHTDAHRAFYTQYRKAAKAPVMLAAYFPSSDDRCWYVEVKETGESLCTQIKACCSWCAKTEGVGEWVRRKKG